VAVDSEVSLREFYNDYVPPRYVFKTVRTLLNSIPEKYVRGLDCVVLTNQSGLPRRDRLGKTTSRKRRLPQSSVAGRYHPAWQGKLPWIEIFVDKICTEPPNGGGLIRRWLGTLPLTREFLLGRVLFHEVGHHAHATVAPEHREKEDVADAWARRLSKNFIRNKYWYLVPVRKPMAWLLRAWAAELRRRGKS
jgi:hypothetical protein